MPHAFTAVAWVTEERTCPGQKGQRTSRREDARTSPAAHSCTPCRRNLRRYAVATAAPQIWQRQPPPPCTVEVECWARCSLQLTDATRGHTVLTARGGCGSNNGADGARSGIAGWSLADDADAADVLRSHQRQRRYAVTPQQAARTAHSSVDMWR